MWTLLFTKVTSISMKNPYFIRHLTLSERAPNKKCVTIAWKRKTFVMIFFQLKLRWRTKREKHWAGVSGDHFGDNEE